MNERTTQRSNVRWIALLAVALMFAVACGQKPEVHVSSGFAGAFQGGQVNEQGQIIDPETGEVLGTVPGGGTGGGGGGTGGTGGGGSSGSGGSGSGGDVKAGPNDKNGVSNNRILVGFHAPLTGAAAVPLTDIAKGVNLYNNWLKSKGYKGVHGREIVTVFRDDQYSPSHAVEVCRDMVENEKVFLLIGGAGTDQILACAQYAARRGVPYLSAGVTENTLKGLPNYFAFSMSYPQQAKPLAEMVHRFDAGQRGGRVYVDRCPEGTAAATDQFCAQSGGGTPKVAVVFSNTEGFFDARDEFLKQWRAVSGRDVDGVFAITKFNMSTGQANDVIQKLKSGGFDVVYALTAPTNWLAMLRVAEGQRYAPRWVGVGLTMGINTVASVGCSQSRNSFSNSLFLNPWYSVDNQRAHQFDEAWRQFGDGDGRPKDHDIAFGLWGGSIVQHMFFEAAGRNLGRAAFMKAVRGIQNGKAVDSTPAGDVIDVYSVQNFSANDNFGASQAHLIYGDCSQSPGRWSDIQQFVSGF